MDSFCSLCGGRIEPHDGSPTGEAGLRWDAEVRAVRTRAYVHGAYVTGLGFLNRGWGVVAPSDAGASYWDARERLETHELRPRLSLFWCFPIHGLCWDLMRAAVDPARTQPVAAVAAHLFALLYNIPSDRQGHPTPAHGYGGALDFHGLEAWWRVERHLDLFYLLADPNDAFDFTPSPTPLLAAPSAIPCLPDARDETWDIFRKLPSEVLMLILENMPSPDCGHLRRASRYTASVTPVSQLPPSFWRSRFEWPNEMAFVFAGREDQVPPGPNWRQMYTAARGMLKAPGTYPGFRHRYRIWQMLQYLAPALSLRLQNARYLARGPYGGRVPGLPMEASHCFGTASAKLVREHDGASEGPADCAAMRPFYEGCRLYEEQCLHWADDGASETVCLAVSSVPLNGGIYISGLRYTALHQHVAPREYARVGLVDLSNEQRVCLNKSDILEAMVFNVQTDGILGLRLDLRGPTGLTTYSFGHLEPSQADAGYTHISYRGQLRHARFLVGLDACKIVALSLRAPEGLEECDASDRVA